MSDIQSESSRSSLWTTGLGIRFFIDMENKVTTTGINPRVSYTAGGKFARNGSAMTIVTLKSILDRCASNEFKNREKGASGCILPYVSTKLGERPFVHEGVVILDLDRFNKEPGLRGKENLIYDKFDEIASEYMPNIIAMNFSYSHNLHIFVYDRNVVDAESYNKMQLIYTTYFAWVVKKILDIDFRDYKDALDDHQKAHQKLFVNYSPYKWNDYCTQMTIPPKALKTLQSEYKILFERVNDNREVRESTPIDGNGSIAVDRDYSILGWSGFQARTVIAAAVFFHFKQDITKAKNWLQNKFSNANVIYSQMKSLIRSGFIVHWYHKEVEDVLFQNEIEKYRLEDGVFLSNVIDFDTLNDRYYYIQSNTNTGKTEFVKNLIRDKYTEVEVRDNLFCEKKSIKVEGKKVIILQITKALRDGKKQGIEDKTYNNWDGIVDVDQIHTTLEGFDRNVANLRLEEYTIIVDESHLLEEYITIRYDITRRILRCLERANKVIFMSATPKSDINLFPFKRLIFEKIQKQTLDVYQYPINVTGKGRSKEKRYIYLVDTVKELANRGEKVLVFSNRKQIEWKSAGLDEGVTMFNSSNITDNAVREILENNRLINNITLATKYMGCGVEVKGEKKVHIVFLLDEGWNFDFIVQALGRPRDAENICLHLFYTASKKWTAGLTPKQLSALQNALNHLSAYSKTGIISVNVLAAKMTGVYDIAHQTYKEGDKLSTLIIGNVLTDSLIQTPYSVELFKYLPYEKINVHINDKVCVSNVQRSQKTRMEKELIEYLCNCSDKEWDKMMEMEYEEIFRRVPYRDKAEARNTIRICKYIKRNHLDLKKVMDYFCNVSKAERYVKALVTYTKIEAGMAAVESFEGSKMTEKELRSDIKMMKSIFTKEFIEEYITEFIHPELRPTKSIDFTFDVFMDILKMIGIAEDDSESVVDEIPNPINNIKMFNTDTYHVPREVVNSINGKKGGRSKQSISIKVIATGEEKTFGSKSECSEYMRSVGYSARQFNKLLKGEGDLTALYKVL